MLEIYGQLPSYRAMLDKEGYATPVDAALIGDEDTLRQRISEIEASGVTDFGAAIYDLEDGAPLIAHWLFWQQSRSPYYGSNSAATLRQT